MAEPTIRTPTDGASSTRTLPIAREEKRRILAEQERLRIADLWEGRQVFASRPRVLDMQFSNFCNMSCTMCYDGVNPPLEKMPEDQVRRFATEVFPTASVVVPFAGSEPLIVTWDLTRELAERYCMNLDLITNVQYLDERKFAELEPFVSTITFSIDSHVRDVYDRIRLKARSDKVFENLPRAARLCREHGIEPQANVVWMVENAPWIDETVGYLADAGIATIRILQYEHLPGVSFERSYSDAATHLSPQWMEWMKERMRQVARSKRIRLIFDMAHKEWVDCLPQTTFRADDKPQPLLGRLQRFFPGYCWQSLDRLKVLADGDVYPCCKGTGDNLRLGNVYRQDFESIWNGPEARDLRRGMLTWDLPSLCQGCSFHTAWFLEPQPHLPFIDWVHDVAEPRLPRDSAGHVLEVESPPHMTRSVAAPVFRWRAPANLDVERWVLALAIGGEWHPLDRIWSIAGDAREFTIPQAEWEALKPNVGWWWCLWGVVRDGGSVRAATTRCVIRHQDIARVPGSKLFGAAAAAPV